MNPLVSIHLMDWFLLVISSAAFVSILLYQDLLGRAKVLNRVPVKVLRVVRAAGVSDHWKEKILPRYALQLLLQSLTVFALLLVALSPFFVSAIISSQVHGEFLHLTASFPGILASTASAILFAKILPKRVGGDYGAGSRILHQLVLDHAFIGETLFDIEKTLHGAERQDVSEEKHVFVAGLARAGTTILMRTLYENGNFLSLTYRDMPFVLAPNSWRTCSKMFSRDGQKQERAHGDGIEVDYDSPEALEEVFWRTFCGNEYIKKDSLVPMKADGETVANFKDFISIVLKSAPGKRYLSKNNNNILRLDSICRTFPNAVIIVPFREPLQQAYSLRSQHRKFVGEEDPFTGKYMTWLAHHEFGVYHRPFVFDEKMGDTTDTEDINYWVQLWVNTYSYLLENLPSGAVLLSYEALCDNSAEVWQQLSQIVDLKPYGSSICFSKAYRPIDEDVLPDLFFEAQELYGKLSDNSIGGNLSVNKPATA